MRGVIGMIFAVVILLAVQTLLVRFARHYYSNLRFFDLLVTGDDNRYSLSRFQVYVWTAIIIVVFSALTAARLRFADFPQNLLLLMGVNLASAVAATAITTAKSAGATSSSPTPSTTAPTSAAPGATSAATGTPSGPNFFRDIFLESGASVPSLDLPRTQMFAWTAITIIVYLVLFTRHFPSAEVLVSGAAQAPLLPDIPQGMVALMGLSNGAYLGVKAAK